MGKSHSGTGTRRKQIKKRERKRDYIWFLVVGLLRGFVYYVCCIKYLNPVHIVKEKQKKLYYTDEHGKMPFKPKLRDRIVDLFQSEEQRRKKLIAWVKHKIPSKSVNNFTTSWHDGISLCALLQSICPGICPGFHLLKPHNLVNNCRLGIRLANQCLNIPETMLTPEEMAIPDHNTEQKVFQFILAIKISSDKITIFQYLNPTDNNFKLQQSSTCTVKGPGLNDGVVGRKVRFSVFISDVFELFKLSINIRGPRNEVYSENVVSLHQSCENSETDVQSKRDLTTLQEKNTEQLEDLHGNIFVRVKNIKDYGSNAIYNAILFSCQCIGEGSFQMSFIPVSAGIHTLSIRWQDSHVNGSPYKVKVYQPRDITRRAIKDATDKRHFFDSLSLSSIDEKNHGSLDRGDSLTSYTPKLEKIDSVREEDTPPKRNKSDRFTSRMRKQYTVTKRRVLRKIITKNGEEIIIQESSTPSVSRQSSMSAENSDNAEEEGKGYANDLLRASPASLRSKVYNKRKLMTSDRSVSFSPGSSFDSGRASGTKELLRVESASALVKPSVLPELDTKIRSDSPIKEYDSFEKTFTQSIDLSEPYPEDARDQHNTVGLVNEHTHVLQDSSMNEQPSTRSNHEKELIVSETGENIHSNTEHHSQISEHHSQISEHNSQPSNTEQYTQNFEQFGQDKYLQGQENSVHLRRDSEYVENLKHSETGHHIHIYGDEQHPLTRSHNDPGEITKPFASIAEHEQKDGLSKHSFVNHYTQTNGIMPNGIVYANDRSRDDDDNMSQMSDKGLANNQANTSHASDTVQNNFAEGIENAGHTLLHDHDHEENEQSTTHTMQRNWEIKPKHHKINKLVQQAATDISSDSNDSGSDGTKSEGDKKGRTAEHTSNAHGTKTKSESGSPTVKLLQSYSGKKSCFYISQKACSRSQSSLSNGSLQRSLSISSLQSGKTSLHETRSLPLIDDAQREQISKRSFSIEHPKSKVDDHDEKRSKSTNDVTDTGDKGFENRGQSVANKNVINNKTERKNDRHIGKSFRGRSEINESLLEDHLLEDSKIIPMDYTDMLSEVANDENLNMDEEFPQNSDSSDSGLGNSESVVYQNKRRHSTGKTIHKPAMRTASLQDTVLRRKDTGKRNGLYRQPTIKARDSTSIELDKNSFEPNMAVIYEENKHPVIQDSTHAHSLQDSVHVHSLQDSTHVDNLQDSAHVHNLQDSAHVHNLQDSTYLHNLQDTAHVHNFEDFMTIISSESKVGHRSNIPRVHVVIPKPKSEKFTQVAWRDIVMETGYEEPVNIFKRKCKMNLANKPSVSTMSSYLSEDDKRIISRHSSDDVLPLEKRSRSLSVDAGFQHIHESERLYQYQMQQGGNYENYDIVDWMNQEDGNRLLQPPVRQSTVDTIDSGIAEENSPRTLRRSTGNIQRNAHGHQLVCRRPYKGRIDLDPALIESGGSNPVSPTHDNKNIHPFFTGFYKHPRLGRTPYPGMIDPTLTRSRSISDSRGVSGDHVDQPYYGMYIQDRNSFSQDSFDEDLKANISDSPRHLGKEKSCSFSDSEINYSIGKKRLNIRPFKRAQKRFKNQNKSNYNGRYRGRGHKNDNAHAQNHPYSDRGRNSDRRNKSEDVFVDNNIDHHEFSELRMHDDMTDMRNNGISISIPKLSVTPDRISVSTEDSYDSYSGFGISKGGRSNLLETLTAFQNLNQGNVESHTLGRFQNDNAKRYITHDVYYGNESIPDFLPTGSETDDSKSRASPITFYNPNTKRYTTCVEHYVNSFPLRTVSSIMVFFPDCNNYPCTNKNAVLVERTGTLPQCDENFKKLNVQRSESTEAAIEIPHIESLNYDELPQCRVEGSGLSFGNVGTKNNFQVWTENSGNGSLSVDIYGPRRHSVLETSIVYTGDNLYEVVYEVSRPGFYIICVKWSDVAVPDSPFLCKITY